MQKILKLEEAFLFAFSIFLFSQLDFAWWWFPLLILTPDLSMLGYLHSPKTGALTYNFIHHKGVGVAVYVLGVLLAQPVLMLVGVILFGHSSMDRVFGYGLKYPDAFEHTHLGWIGKNVQK
ncbi:MAG TPA: DUF4260 domain-containing protein [Anaerolineales bacterium]|nr:DUF4260 domain-containing protein [Anaerolineales bacterium]